eukprot:6201204-Pleurochrysis_carterae.AAC.2
MRSHEPFCFPPSRHPAFAAIVTFAALCVSQGGCQAIEDACVLSEELTRVRDCISSHGELCGSHA